MNFLALPDDSVPLGCDGGERWTALDLQCSHRPPLSSPATAGPSKASIRIPQRTGPSKAYQEASGTTPQPPDPLLISPLVSAHHHLENPQSYPLDFFMG